MSTNDGKDQIRNRLVDWSNREMGLIADHVVAAEHTDDDFSAATTALVKRIFEYLEKETDLDWKMVGLVFYNLLSRHYHTCMQSGFSDTRFNITMQETIGMAIEKAVRGVVNGAWQWSPKQVDPEPLIQAMKDAYKICVQAVVDAIKSNE